MLLVTYFCFRRLVLFFLVVFGQLVLVEVCKLHDHGLPKYGGQAPNRQLLKSLEQKFEMKLFFRENLSRIENVFWNGKKCHELEKNLKLFLDLKFLCLGPVEIDSE